MTIESLDRLYDLAGSAEVLRVVVSEERADRFTATSRKIETFLGAVAQEDPWFSALSALRRARWVLHTIPLPGDHPALELRGLLASSTTRLEPLCAEASEELQHWVNEAHTALTAIVEHDDAALADAVIESLTDGADPSATVVLAHAAGVAATEERLRSEGVPFASVLTAPAARGRAAHDSQLIIGPSRLFPDWLFMAPRAELITVVHRASTSDRGEISSALPTGGLAPVRIRGQSTRRISVAAFEVQPPPVNWGAVRPLPTGQQHPEDVRARAFLLAGSHSVLLDAGDSAMVFTVDPTASGDALVERIPTTTVQPGAFLLLRQELGDEDAIVLLANQILGSRAAFLRAEQRRWKIALREAVDRDGIELAEARLHDMGCKASNLGRWLSDEGIRTQRRDDFAAICLYSGIADADAAALWEAMGTIHGAHIKAGHQMRDMLEQQLQDTDLSALHTTGWIEVHLPDVDAGALAIYRVEARDDAVVLVHPRKLRVATRTAVL